MTDVDLKWAIYPTGLSAFPVPSLTDSYQEPNRMSPKYLWQSKLCHLKAASSFVIVSLKATLCPK